MVLEVIYPTFLKFFVEKFLWVIDFGDSRGKKLWNDLNNVIWFGCE